MATWRVRQSNCACTASLSVVKADLFEALTSKIVVLHAKVRVFSS